MKLKPLQAILNLPQYEHIPLELTQLEVKEADTRHCIVQTLEKHTFELVVWEIGQHMMALFDTYPEHVLEVELDSEFTLYVNREEAGPLSPDFFIASNAQTLEAMKKCDSFETFNTVASFIDKLPKPYLFEQDQKNESLLRRTVLGTFNSSLDIEAKLTQHLGLVRAKLDTIRLSQVAQAGGRALPRQASKPGM